MYQINRNEINSNFFLIYLLCLFLIIEGMGQTMYLISMILFEFFRSNQKKNKYLFIFLPIVIAFLGYYGFLRQHQFITFFNFYDQYTDLQYYLFSFILPRISIHSEQLYAYIMQDLSISNYQYLFNIIIESFNNRLKIIFEGYENLFYPKTVGQSIVFDMQEYGVKGGSSPGYVLSVISFLPFNLPIIVILALTIKQFAFRINERINLIQVACLCFIFKSISANLLDMLSIIEPMLLLLLLAFISTNVYLKNNK
jgi:hypothetical protein